MSSIGCGPKENQYECVVCLFLLDWKGHVHGSSSQKGENGTKFHQKKKEKKKVILENFYHLPPFCFWGLLMCLLKDNKHPLFYLPPPLL